MNIYNNLGVIFKDKEWLKKTLLGGLFLMVPVVNLLTFGFLAKFIHSHLEEGEKKLPSWDNWGSLLWNGLEWSLIIIIYLVIPLSVLSLLPESVFTFIVNPEFVFSRLNSGGYTWFTLSTLLTIFALFFLPMALILFVDTGSFINAFHFKKVFSHIKKNIKPYLIAYILTIILFGVNFYNHYLLTKLKFGIIPSYFLFMWIGFIILLISGSLFTESF